MSSEASVEDINRDIAALYEKVKRSGASKQDLLIAIQKEREAANELQFFISEDQRRTKKGEHPAYDVGSMRANIDRCHGNISLFETTINKEDENITNFHYMIGVLQEDLVRPCEIVYDAKTGQVIEKRLIQWL